MLNTGEQCDDHNLVDNDLCPNDCKYTIGKTAIRGNRRNLGKDKSGCQVEWFVAKSLGMDKDKYGKPSLQQTCVDGDNSCDYSTGADGICEFKVVVCVSNDSSGLACKAHGLSSLMVLAPRPDQARTEIFHDAQAENLAVVQNAFVKLLNPADPTAGYVNAPPIPDGVNNLCSQPFSIKVPLAGLSRRTVKIKTLSADNIFPNTRSNVSSLRLRCRLHS